MAVKAKKTKIQVQSILMISRLLSEAKVTIGKIEKRRAKMRDKALLHVVEEEDAAEVEASVLPRLSKMKMKALR